MKKRLFALLLATFMISALFAGCGSSSTAAGYDQAVNKEVYAEAPAEPAAGEAEEMKYDLSNSITADKTTSSSLMEQKLIKRVHISAETEDLEALLPQLGAKIQELGGYIESQELYNGSPRSSYRSRSISMTVRIPAEHLGDFTSRVEGISNVVNYSESADDVTLQYVDTESRIKALEVEQERLLELLAQAENMTDLLEIEARLTDVRYELERYSSQLRTLENKVNYATVYLNIDQVRVYTEVEPQTVWQRISGGFSKNLRDIGENLTNFFVWAVTYSPQLLFWGIVISFALILFRRRAAKKKARKAPAQPPEDKTQ